MLHRRDNFRLTLSDPRSKDGLFLRMKPRSATEMILLSVGSSEARKCHTMHHVRQNPPVT